MHTFCVYTIPLSTGFISCRQYTSISCMSWMTRLSCIPLSYHGLMNQCFKQLLLNHPNKNQREARQESRPASQKVVSCNRNQAPSVLCTIRYGKCLTNFKESSVTTSLSIDSESACTLDIVHPIEFPKISPLLDRAKDAPKVLRPNPTSRVHISLQHNPNKQACFTKKILCYRVGLVHGKSIQK